ncbi:MAG: FtsQ-type POTRA domain-containing protein [Oscillospiraceae bacterium]|nr:FtsQ-type POTRA domain-containing protein [Oscillospiraceae bacterium]
MSKQSAIFIAIGVLLVGIMTFIGTSVFVRILDIEISGVVVYTEQEVLEASRVSFGDNLLHLNVQTVSQNIRSNLPFVRDVNIERRLPDTLIIDIVESIPIAYVFFTGDVLILDSSGRVLQSGDYDTENLIEVRGLPIRNASRGQQLIPELGAETRFLDLQDILAAFERENLVEQVSYIDVSNIQNIHFGYLDIYRVILGNAGELRQKIYSLRNSIIFLNRNHPGVPGAIDVSDPTAEPVFNRVQDPPVLAPDTTTDGEQYDSEYDYDDLEATDSEDYYDTQETEENEEN